MKSLDRLSHSCFRRGDSASRPYNAEMKFLLFVNAPASAPGEVFRIHHLTKNPLISFKSLDTFNHPFDPGRRDASPLKRRKPG
jgi:hypothetical protein